MHHTDSLWDRIWRDRHDDVVIWQNPNRYLIAWVVLTLVSMFTNGKFSYVVWYLSLAVLAFWAGLEVWKGVNYFRKALGVVVLLMIVAAIFKLGY